MRIILLVAIIFTIACEKNTVESKSKLDAPTYLRATPSGNSNIRLKWNDNSNSESGFKLERKENNTDWQEIFDLPENATSTIDTQIDFNKNYIYRVVAYTITEKSQYSNEASINCRQFFELVFVVGDTFTMGDSWGDGTADSRPTHLVTLNSFYISKYEITNTKLIDMYNWALEQGKIYVSSYRVFLVNGDYTGLFDLSDYNSAYSYNVNKFSVVIEPQHPATDVSWFGAIAYCNFLSERYGFKPCYDLNDWSCDWTADGFRLPTEAEWEFAARGGKKTKAHKYSGSNNPDDTAWYYLNSNRSSHVVGTKLPNELGIYDMIGNVWEWIWNYWSPYSSQPQDNPTGPLIGFNRVIRGSSWYGTASSILYSVSDRGNYDPTTMGTTFGFRITKNY
jgi:formylglycine-generating enzyme required for sulfatase activity